jgi:N-acetylglucosamine-6-phosphate deacetylase
MFDLQVNGFHTESFSCDFWNEPSEEEIDHFLKYLHKQGVKKILATLITAAPEKIRANLNCIQNYINKYQGNNTRAEIVGVHIEGGYISRLGVHPAQFADALNCQFAKNITHEFPGLIKLWTLCPLVDRDGSLTRLIQDNSITVSYGHSNASYQQAMEAFEHFGVRLVTHWGNAMYVMQDFKQRSTTDIDLAKLDEIDIDRADPNSIGIGLAAYRHPEVYCMAIAGSKSNGDLHLDPRLLKKLAEHKRDKFILVSDCVTYSGAKPETLVGGLDTLAQHKQNALNAGIDPVIVEAAVSVNPSNSLGFKL